MEALIWLVILAAGGIVSLLNKSRERKELMRKLEEEDREEQRTGKPRPAYEETVRSARPRGAQTRRTQVEMPQDIEDVIRQLMGEPPRPAPAAPAPRSAIEEDHEGENDEGDWQPAPPPVRRELSPEIQRPRQPARQPQQRRQAAGPPQRPGLRPPEIRQQPQRPVRQAAEPATRQAQPRQRPAIHAGEAERRETEAIRRQPHAEQPPAARQTRRVPPTRRRRILGNLYDVRRAIVLAEIIGPPRAFQDLDPRA